MLAIGKYSIVLSRGNEDTRWAMADPGLGGYQKVYIG